MAIWIHDFVHLLESKAGYIQMFSLHNMNSEGWLQAELLYFLTSRPESEIVDCQPQKQGSTRIGRNQRHDIFVETPDHKLWCELKSFSTNYCGCPGKNITDRIDGLLEAMDRVSGQSQQAGGIPVVMGLIYPFCGNEIEKREWEKHWQKLCTGALTRHREYPLRFPHFAERYARFITWSSPKGEEVLFA